MALCLSLPASRLSTYILCLNLLDTPSTSQLMMRAMGTLKVIHSFIHSVNIYWVIPGATCSSPSVTLPLPRVRLCFGTPPWAPLAYPFPVRRGIPGTTKVSAKMPWQHTHQGPGVHCPPSLRCLFQGPFSHLGIPGARVWGKAGKLAVRLGQGGQ